MINSLEILKGLLILPGYWLLLIAFTLAVFFLRRNPSVNSIETRFKHQGIFVWIWAFLVFIILSFPYWFFGSDAAHSGPDDVTHTLQTYLSASHQGDSINWTNALLGGMDRWLLPNAHPLSLGRIFALFLQPYQLYLLVIGINIVCVFVFSWKIQTQLWQIKPWLAYLGALLAVFIEGYWTGIFPNAHISNGHGFAIVIVGIYYLSKYHQEKIFWLVGIVVGVAMALGSWIPFHNLPVLLVTITIWGLSFWGRRAWIKVIFINFVVGLTVLLIVLPQFLAIKSLYASSGRGGIFFPTVDLKGFYQFSVLILAGLMAGAFFILRNPQDKKIRQVLIMFLGFFIVPLAAYCFEISRILPAFRWHLLYVGNEAWFWLAGIFIIDRIYKFIERSFRLLGIFLKIFVLTISLTIIIFAWMNSLWFDLDSSYPSGNWKTLTDTTISKGIKLMDPKPMRVVGVGETNDIHFWGQYQGLENFLGYTPFIDQRKIKFWWKSALGFNHEQYVPTGYLSLPAAGEGPRHRHLTVPFPLQAILNIDALKLANVNWVVSHHPLYPVEGLQLISAQPGQMAVCSQESTFLYRFDLEDIKQYWKDIACIVKDFRYERSFYVYHVKDALSRAYIATEILTYSGKELDFLTQEQIKVASQGAAIIGQNFAENFKDQRAFQAIEMQQYQSDYMRLSLNIQKESLVVISSTLNQYWHVLVDGKRVNSFDVNLFQSGFWAPQAAKTAELIYCPPSRLHIHPNCSKR